MNTGRAASLGTTLKRGIGTRKRRIWAIPSRGKTWNISSKATTSVTTRFAGVIFFRAINESRFASYRSDVPTDARHGSPGAKLPGPDSQSILGNADHGSKPARTPNQLAAGAAHRRTRRNARAQRNGRWREVRRREEVVSARDPALRTRS